MNAYSTDDLMITSKYIFHVYNIPEGMELTVITVTAAPNAIVQLQLEVEFV